MFYTTEGEASDKVPEPSTGSAVKFEEGLASTEEDVPPVPEETGEQPDGLLLTISGLS